MMKTGNGYTFAETIIFVLPRFVLLRSSSSVFSFLAQNEEPPGTEAVGTQLPIFSQVFYGVSTFMMVVLLIILVARGEVKGSVQSWCIAASNAWGLFVLTVPWCFPLN